MNGRLYFFIILFNHVFYVEHQYRNRSRIALLPAAKMMRFLAAPALRQDFLFDMLVKIKIVYSNSLQYVLLIDPRGTGTKKVCQVSLKGQSHEIFDPWFFR
jgi:hypothetical protein